MNRQRLIEELGQGLECPVCHELPSVPIFLCPTGHLVCERCKQRIQSCPLCRETYTDARDFFAEANLDSVNRLIYGPALPSTINLPDGTAGVPGRIIRCCLAMDGCRNKIMGATAYIDHLILTHGAVVTSCATGKFIHKVQITPTAKTLVKRGTDRLFLMEVSNKIFIVNMCQDEKEIFIWAGTAPRSLDTKLSTARFCIPMTGNQRKITWVGKINGLHVNDRSVGIYGTCLKLSPTQLKNCLQPNANGSSFWVLEVYIYSSIMDVLRDYALTMRPVWNDLKVFTSKIRPALAVPVNGIKSWFNWAGKIRPALVALMNRIKDWFASYWGDILIIFLVLCWCAFIILSNRLIID